MKNGYTCACGWHLDRGTNTRKEYAGIKEHHAFRDSSLFSIVTKTIGCQHLRKELEQSRKAK